MSETAAIPVASRVHGFSYAIRNIVAEAKKVEATGRTVKYLEHRRPDPLRLQDAGAHDRRRREGHARRPQRLRPVAGHHVGARGGGRRFHGARRADDARPRRADGGHVRRHRDRPQRPGRIPGDEVLVPSPTYPLYTAVIAKIAAKTVYYRTDPKNGWLPDLDEIRSLITPKTRALVVIDPNNPTGAIYPESIRRELIALASTARVRPAGRRGVRRPGVRRADAADGRASTPRRR